MASHKLTPAADNFGTSFASPRVSNKLARLHELEELSVDQISAPLLKAFLFNSASYLGNLDRVNGELDTVDKKKWLDVVGYGMPDAERATECDDYSIVLFHQGMIEPNKVAFFDIPIPSALTDSTGRKRMTVTVAHYPEVQRWGLESYFGADLKWRLFRGNVDRDAVVEAMSVSNDEEDDEASETKFPNEVRFEHGMQRRSRGTVQHDWHDWMRHCREFSENHYTLAIASHKRWSRAVEPIPLVVVLRIEDIGATVPIYTEVANAVQALIESRSRGVS